jgi:hypothetical protein
VFAVIKYVLGKWDYRKEKQIVKIKNGDFLIGKLNLRGLTRIDVLKNLARRNRR